jgi:alpha-L-arabinofuranosidase
LEVHVLNGDIALDMLSLFTQKTFNNRKNGLRADLAQAIADIHPRFVRFPGGCVAHGDGLENMYRWKNTIGAPESRKPQRNIWGYHQTAGLGYFEYFQFCEDIGAEAVPIVPAGVPCQNSAHHGHRLGGQQGGIPMDEMEAYVQEVLDLIEWANGDKNTVWGRKRAEAGHPAPFNLKYIGVGNEDLISDVFEDRFTLIFKAIQAKYPEITVIGTVGPFSEGADYREGWDIAAKLNVPVVDEHYYQPPAWFIYNQDYYDKYDRSKSKVYLGEYAAHLPGRPNNLETALSEALYLTALERNGDVVVLSSYAPLLAKEGHTNWNPDLIYFNNTEVKPTVGYHVQKIFGENAGDEYIPSLIQLNNGNPKIRNRIACSVVKDSRTNDLILKMVNLLPVAVTLNVETVFPAGSILKKTVLQGNPDDKALQPVESVISEAELNELAPYSFTTVRIKH